MKLSKIIYYSLIGLFTFLCFYISFEVISAIKNDLPVSVFSYSISYVPTNSMEDEIMPGEYVLFKKTSFEQVDEDDIIVYKSKSGDMKGNYIIHRVMEEHDDYFITQGDNNPLPDEENITSDMVIGKYIKVVKFVGFINNNKTIIVILLFSFVFVGLMSQFVTEYFKKQQEENKVEQEKHQQELLEQLRKEILEEELNKLKNKK